MSVRPACLGLAAAALAAATLAGPALAQQADRPMSAIDWLSESVRAPDPLAAPPRSDTIRPPLDEDPVARSAAVPEVTVLPLGGASPDPVGLLPPAISGLPRDLWLGSDVETLAALIAAERIGTLPAIRDLLRLLLLAEADPPRSAGTDGELFLSRVDKLLDLGALDPAWEMLEAAGPDTPALFRRYLDVALLSGRESRACRLMAEKPELSPALAARIFCLAHTGDWPAAALTLNTARALGDVSAMQDALLTRFLDPELFEGLPPLPVPDRPTPLDFRMREGIGEGLSTVDLPRAFAHADLRDVNGWKVRLDAAERLARTGAVADAVLLDLYTLRQPAASGGVWERVAAVQALDAALKDGAPGTVGPALTDAWRTMRDAGLEVPLSALFAERLEGLELDGRAGQVALRVGLLGGDYERLARGKGDGVPADPALAAIAAGEGFEARADDRNAAAIAAAFGGAPPPADLLALADEDRLGEAILLASALFDDGLAGDAEALTGALAFLRAVGLEDTARRAALQVLILERP